MTRKAILSFFIVAVFALGCLTSCKHVEKSSDKDVLTNIRSRGLIVVAMEDDRKPWSYKDENDMITGFDVEIAQAVAEKIGIKAEFKTTSWENLFDGLNTESFDVIINGIELTKEREAYYDFSEPYVYSNIAVVARADDDSINSFEDLNGKKTANSLNSSYMVMGQQYGAEVEAKDGFEEIMDMVISGQIDATLNDLSSLEVYIADHPEANLKIADVSEVTSKVCIAIRKSQETENLKKNINYALQDLKKEGTLSSLSEKYFGADYTK